MIEITKASLIKNERTILSDISVKLTESRVGIIGHNGSGKSSFAKLLNGLEPCATGQVRVGGADISKHRARVGFVFQNPDNQLVMPLVEEDIAFGLKKSGLSKSEINDRSDALLKKFGLAHLRERLTHELSGGEKQLIALIGVLIMQPEHIILDEPTTLLDLRNRAILLAMLDKLEQQLIIVSHDLDLMAQMDRLLLIHEGRLHADGDPSQIIATYRDLSV
ncbi:biotin transport ATP-binding protein BioM [Maritalea myrionectae]|uniref:Biotin transport ATP-binding protein BioM n=1 Tax=Maritalea myrionectae TaxID=454601 RepID=A0A2R4M9A2_9HYPH|nr:ABC transporter ATP-binding protein [Maritalea myrionectae]AVX02618.1 biotin transport ATP-binding protein BioM [Maritalea myrionectae]